MEFKGTKEEKAKYYAENWEEITGLDWEDAIPVNVSELDYLAGYNQALEDSKAPEILEMLNRLVNQLEYQQGYVSMLTSEGKMLIKEATKL